MILYRTTGAWGAGIGANLTAAQVDGNFYDLSSRVQFIELNPAEPVQIEDFTSSGELFYIHMSNGDIHGPLALPTIRWNFRGPWEATTHYLKDDVVVGPDSNVYLVTFEHTSASTFDAGANDGSGHDYYSLLLIAPAAVLPVGGVQGMVLTKSTDLDYSVMWADAGIPSGGDLGDVLTKLTSDDYDRAWRPLNIAATIYNIAGTTLTPSLAQANGFFRCSNAAGCTVTIPDDDTVAFPIGTELSFRQGGAGPVTLVESTEVAFNGIEGYDNATNITGAVLTAKKVNTDEWDVFGFLTAATA